MLTRENSAVKSRYTSYSAPMQRGSKVQGHMNTVFSSIDYSTTGRLG